MNSEMSSDEVLGPYSNSSGGGELLAELLSLDD